MLNDLTIMNFIILFLATYRIAYLLTQDIGPFEIFQRIREYFGVFDLYNNGEETRYFDISESHNKLIGEILDCIYCTGIWVGLFLSIGFYIIPMFTIIIALPFAISSSILLFYKD